MTLYDELCQSIIDRNPNMMIPWYLMAAYAYYIEANPILSEDFYHKMTRKMLAKWHELHHFHKSLITQGDLEAGTLLVRDYPQRVIGAVDELRRNSD